MSCWTAENNAVHHFLTYLGWGFDKQGKHLATLQRNGCQVMQILQNTSSD